MVTKVLMVCLGNICRSPLAEGILQNKINPENVFIDSAGTGGYHIGNKPDLRSIAVAAKYGIDITKQRCRKFGVQDFDDFDIIYVMDKSNYNNVIDLSRSDSDKNKVQLLLNVYDSEVLEVPDPYYDEQDGFEYVYHLIDKACEEIAIKLNAIHNS